MESGREGSSSLLDSDHGPQQRPRVAYYSLVPVVRSGSTERTEAALHQIVYSGALLIGAPRKKEELEDLVWALNAADSHGYNRGLIEKAENRRPNQTGDYYWLAPVRASSKNVDSRSCTILFGPKHRPAKYGVSGPCSQLYFMIEALNFADRRAYFRATCEL